MSATRRAIAPCTPDNFERGFYAAANGYLRGSAMSWFGETRLRIAMREFNFLGDGGRVNHRNDPRLMDRDAEGKETGYVTTGEEVLRAVACIPADRGVYPIGERRLVWSKQLMLDRKEIYTEIERLWVDFPDRVGELYSRIETNPLPRSNRRERKDTAINMLRAIYEDWDAPRRARVAAEAAARTRRENALREAREWRGGVGDFERKDAEGIADVEKTMAGVYEEIETTRRDRLSHVKKLIDEIEQAREGPGGEGRDDELAALRGVEDRLNRALDQIVADKARAKGWEAEKAAMAAKIKELEAAVDQKETERVGAVARMTDARVLELEGELRKERGERDRERAGWDKERDLYESRSIYWAYATKCIPTGGSAGAVSASSGQTSPENGGSCMPGMMHIRVHATDTHTHIHTQWQTPASARWTVWWRGGRRPRG